MIKVDDRTAEQKQTHRWGIVARDKFMSGWGPCRNGVSRCAWACAPDADLDALERWVNNRSEMRYVNKVDLNTYRPPSGTAHFHIYVCDREHTSQPSYLRVNQAVAPIEHPTREADDLEACEKANMEGTR